MSVTNTKEVEMDINNVKEARMELDRFSKKLRELERKLEKTSPDHYWLYVFSGCKETATVKRSSMDLSNALVKLR